MSFVQTQGKSTISPISYPSATKFATVFPASLVLEGRSEGGYQQADSLVFGPPDSSFSTHDLEWRNTVEPCEQGEAFFHGRKGDLPLDTVRKEATLGGGAH